jgi:phenylacetate-CoA ligase
MAATGGSTGQPLKVLLDFESVFKENAFIYYFRRSVGYRFEDRLATFRGIEFEDKLWKYNPMHNELTFSPFKLSKVTLNKYVDKINEYNPQYLNGYLSAIYAFAKFLEESDIKLSIRLKGIFLISENIDNNQRNFIEKFFNVDSLTFYGHSERCIIAQEKKHNLYVFDPFYGYTEFIESENGLRSIAGTGFLSRTMPLIRYITDDTCEPEGRYYSIKGKRMGTMGVYGKNDEFFGQAAFNFHNDMFRNVLNYQFVQRKKGECDFLIVVNKDFNVTEIEIMHKEIDKKSKGIIDFNIKVVENLILSPAGKFNMIVSYLPKDISQVI